MSTVNLGGEKAVITKNKAGVKNYKVLDSQNGKNKESSEQKCFGIPKMLWIWVSVLVFISVAVLIVVECRLLEESASSSDSPPNFVLIVLDDLGWKDISS